MITILHVCGCSQERPCDTGAKLFSRSLWARLARHLEQSIQVNREYPEVTPGRRRTGGFATLGDVARMR